MKKLITNYTFVPGKGGVGYITFNDYSVSNPFNISTLQSILNTSNGRYIHIFDQENKCIDNQEVYFANNQAVVTSGNKIIFPVDTDMHSSGDKLQIWIEESDSITVGGETSVGNVENILQDSFGSGDLSKWDISIGSGDIVNIGGNVAGAAYLRIIKPVDQIGSVTTIVSKSSFNTPVKVDVNLSISNRIPSQESGFELVGINDSGNIDLISNRPLLVPSSLQVFALGTLTITFTNKHNIRGTERVFITGNDVSLINVGPAVATVVTPYQITVPINNSVAVNTYSVGSTTAQVIEHSQARNTLGIYFASSVTTQADFIVRDGGSMRASTGQTIATTTANVAATSPVSDALLSGSKYSLDLSGAYANVGSKSADSTGSSISVSRFDDIVPDTNKKYKIRFRTINHPSMSYVKSTIQSISKSGSSVATVTTATPHGMTGVNNWIAIYGVLDQTNFANISVVQITSVINTTQFTVAWGTNTTATSSGGSIAILQGSVALPTFFNGAIQSISASDNILTIVMNTAASGAQSGEAWQICGMTGSASAYNGIYKVLRMAVNSFELEKIDGGTITTTTTINTGGLFMRCTEYRIHNFVAEQYTYIRTQLSTSGSADQNNLVPVSVSNTPSVQQSNGTSSSIWNAAGYGGVNVADIASAVITTSNTSSYIQPGMTANIGAYSNQYVIEVTNLTGVGAFMDVVIEESSNTGTNSYPIYHFERITASGVYISPVIRSQGNRIRYIRTLGGTTPSVTCSVSRIMWSHQGQVFRQFFDRTINPLVTTTPTPTYRVDGGYQIMALINTGSVTTTAATYQLRGSEDGANFYDIGAATLAPANKTTVINVVDFIPKFVRLEISGAGVGVTQNYVSIKAIGF